MKLRILLLFCGTLLLVGAKRGTDHKEIDYKKPKYIKRHSEPWKNGGRIIGEIKNPPEKFTIKINKPGGTKPICVHVQPAQLNVYQTKILLPGIYDLIVQAEGYEDIKITNVKIKAGMDCMIKLIFGTRVFHNE